MWVFPEGRTWVIIGFHGPEVVTVEGDVARVRMLVGDDLVDEDFALPKLPPWVPTSPETYEAALYVVIEARIAELAGGLSEDRLAPGSLIHPRPYDV